MAEPGQVYDKNDEKPVYKPDLKKLEGVGESASQQKGHLNLLKKDENLKSSDNSKNLGEAEKKAGDKSGFLDQLGRGFNPSDESFKDKLAKRLTFTSSQKKKGLIGGGVVSLVIGIIVLIIFVLVPLKIEHIVNNLQNHFFGGSSNAIKKESGSLFGNYAKQVLKARRDCKGIIDKGCAPSLFQGGTPVKNLYKSWKQGNLETKLSNDYGIEFKYDTQTKKYYMKAPGMSDPENQGHISEATLNDPNADLFKDFQQVDKQVIRDTVSESFKNETLWNRVMLRFKTGRLLEEKYGVKRCIIFCKQRDAIDALKSSVQAQVNSAKIYLIDRVITPRNEALGISLKCLLVNSCHPEDTTPQDTCETGVSCESAGESVSSTDTTLQSTLDSAAVTQGAEDATTLVADATAADVVGGLESQEITQVLEPIVVEETAANSADEVPWIGWILAADQIVHFMQTAKNVSPKLKKLVYITDAAAAVGLWNMYRTYSDEIKSGNANATEVGSFNTSLGPGDHNGTLDCKTKAGTACPVAAEVGGTASAESTPLYQNVVDGTQTTDTTPASLLNMFVPNTYAQSTSTTTDTSTASADYKCKDGNPIPKGQLICAEEKLGGCQSSSNAAFDTACYIFSALRTLLSSPPFQILYEMARIWDDTFGRLFNLAQDLIQLAAVPLFHLLDSGCSPTASTNIFGVKITVPGPTYLILPAGPTYCAELAIKNAILPKLERVIVDWLIPNPFGTNQSGGRTFDEMAAGADVAGNDYAHHGIGGVQLTPTQSTAIINEEKQQAIRVFQHKPFVARIFDTTSDYSLVTKIAVAMPSNFSYSLQNTLANIFSNPFSLIGHSLASVFTANKVGAQATPQDDPFGVIQYGYPDGTIPTDPEGYWNQYCSDYKPNAPGAATHAYNATAASSLDVNGMPGNSYDPNNKITGGTDPCLLIMATIGSVGGVFDQNNLTPDDLYDTTNANSQAVNNSVYMIGDSLAAGMTGGGLANDLSGAGWTISKIEANPGDNVQAAIPRIQSDSAQVSASGTIIVELGTNNCSLAGTNPTCDSTASFGTQITNMIQAIRAINPTAQIYWQNIYSANGNAYTSINQALSDQAGPQNYKVIDWANQVISNPNTYKFDANSGAIPTGTGFQNMASFIATQLGSPPIATANHPNLVGQTILAENSKQPSVFASVLHRLSRISKVVEQPFKKIDILILWPERLTVW